MNIPLTRPTPPRLSDAVSMLKGIEDRAVFSNFGPVNTAFETAVLENMFDGEGHCLAVCNATIALMVAIQAAIQTRPTERRYALMPSFTFAAAAHAAIWCGLTPLFCDIAPTDWAAAPSAEEELLRRYGDAIAVVVPYATFGYDIDLTRYDDLSRRFNVPVVVDAAASLGTRRTADGRGFGVGFMGTVVFSMHCTKSFATAEGGLIYSADGDRVRELRDMCNFGFGRPRVATTLGLNGKLSEIGALLGQLRLADYDQVMDRRAELVGLYRRALPDLTYQPAMAARQAHQFTSALLPAPLAPYRSVMQATLAAAGIGTATYFSPHAAEQDYFIQHGLSGPLPVTEFVASRIISLPLFDTMGEHEVLAVAEALTRAIAQVSPPPPRRERTRIERPRNAGPLDLLSA